MFFSYLTDRFGRRRLFLVTLAVYLIFSVLTAFSWDFFTFALFRFLAGTRIGGEYSAIYSAIDEMIPARVRGQLALFVGGTYWGTAIVASLLTAVLLNPEVIDQFYGWRIAFALGAALALGVLLVRRYVPESPRWLMTHGKAEEAERVVGEIEDEVRRYTGREELPQPALGGRGLPDQRGVGLCYHTPFGLVAQPGLAASGQYPVVKTATRRQIAP